MTIEGRKQRFCQQCGRFHDIGEPCPRPTVLPLVCAFVVDAAARRLPPCVLPRLPALTGAAACCSRQRLRVAG